MRGLLELVLDVSDLERSLLFYHDVIGLPIVERWPEPRVAVWLGTGRHGVLGLWPPESGVPGVGIHGSRGGSHVHFALYVESETLDERRKTLIDAGYQVEGPVGFANSNRSIFTTDPDGNIVELGEWTIDWAGENIATS